MRSAARWLGWTLAFVVLLVATGILVPRPLWPAAEAASSHDAARHILILSNPIHTDIAIPVDDEIRSRFGFLSSAGVPIDNPAVEYLVVGWGGRTFYLETPTWADLKPMPVMRALTLDSAVLHVDVAGHLPEDAPAISRLAISAPGFSRMLAFVEAGFLRNGGNPLPIPGARYGRHDAFFEAHGVFNAFVGCNTWTARALREAGLRTGTWNPLPQGLALSLWLYN